MPLSITPDRGDHPAGVLRRGDLEDPGRRGQRHRSPARPDRRHDVDRLDRHCVVFAYRGRWVGESGCLRGALIPTSPIRRWLGCAAGMAPCLRECARLDAVDVVDICGALCVGREWYPRGDHALSWFATSSSRFGADLVVSRSLVCLAAGEDSSHVVTGWRSPVLRARRASRARSGGLRCTGRRAGRLSHNSPLVKVKREP